MKRKALIFAALTIFTFILAGCQQAPEATDNTTQQESIGNTGQQNQMQATAPSGNQISGTQNPGTQNNDPQNAGTQNSAEGEISESRAKEIALTDAGVTEADVLAILVKRDFDDGKSVYDVDFYVQNQEFDYEIDAVTGTIISRDFDIENDFLNQTQNAGAGTGANTGTISMEQATAIVLNRVSGATAQNVYMKLENDDGYLKYEGDVYYNGMEYEFELNAQTGDILEWSEERKGY